jgi:hypothetical protein
MFHRARLMRHNLKLRLRRGRRTESKVAMMDADDIEQSRQTLSLPSWACQDVEEEKRLATMKMILNDDLKELHSQKITLANGEKRSLVDAFPDVYSDFRLLRFLRKDKVQDPVAAAKRFRDFIRSRKENNHDELRLQVQTHLFRPPPELAVVNDFLPCDFGEEPAKDGMIPLLLHVGAWDTVSITRSIRHNKLSLSTFLQYWVYMFDSLHLHLYRESMDQKQMIFIDEICDLSQMSLSQISPSFVSNVLKPWIRLTQANYPETAKRIIFLNPPRIISIVWKFVTPMVSPGTVAKVSLQSTPKISLQSTPKVSLQSTGNQ